MASHEVAWPSRKNGCFETIEVAIQHEIQIKKVQKEVNALISHDDSII
jgi:hypothetical protein